jgi:hypothetical protein
MTVALVDAAQFLALRATSTTAPASRFNLASSSNSGSLGDASVVDPGWWATGGSTSCDDGWSIYCLEQ